MCGRFILDLDDNFYPRYKVKAILDEQLKPSYNIFPGQDHPVILESGKGNRIVMAKWDFSPAWKLEKDKETLDKTSTDQKWEKRQLINARLETVEQKFLFRNSFKSSRCLVPATGYYEWQKLEGGKKQPYLIYLDGAKYFSLAGIVNLEPEKPTFLILTRDAYPGLSGIHNRMPVVIREKDEDIWMDNKNYDPEMLKDLAGKFDDKDFKSYKVSTAVNDPENNYSALLAPIA
jgi:putative SOS response-associated peptidase YedK